MQRCLRSGFTLIELLVVIAIISILAGIIFPVFAQAREKGRQAMCISNQRQLGLAFLQYFEDYDETIPGATDGTNGENKTGGWIFYTTFPANRTPDSVKVEQGSLYSYVTNKKVYTCPTDSEGQDSGVSYAINNCLTDAATTGSRPGKALSDFQDTAGILLLSEEASFGDIDLPAWGLHYRSTDDGFQNIYYGNVVSERHSGGASFLFLDGHTKWYKGNGLKLIQLQTGGSDTPCP